jgi:hypothetical protein
MTDYISLKQIAKLSQVSEERAKNMFSMGGAFAMVPRRVDSKGNLIVYRKDFMPHLAKKLEHDARYRDDTQKAWDLHFAAPALYDVSK